MADLDSGFTYAPGDLHIPGFLGELSDQFEEGNAELQQKTDEALAALKKNTSDPELLAKYQSAFSSLTLYRNLQSSVVKKWNDTDAGVIGNFR